MVWHSWKSLNSANTHVQLGAKEKQSLNVPFLQCRYPYVAISQSGVEGGDAPSAYHCFLPLFEFKKHLKTCGHIISPADFYYDFSSLIYCCPLVYQHDCKRQESSHPK